MGQKNSTLGQASALSPSENLVTSFPATSSGNNTKPNATESSSPTENKNNEVRILFFGLAGSGRSTIMNKIRLYMKGQTESSKEDEHKSFKEILQFHAIQSIQQLIQAATILDIPLWEARQLPKELSSETLTQYVEDIKTAHFSINEMNLSTEIGNKIKTIWNLPGSKQIFDFRNDERLSHLNNIATANYFLDNISRISTPNYIPTDDDVKFYHDNFNKDCRGIEELSFEFSNQKYRIFNVEGQNNERRKWLHHFEGVDMICFLCPIGDYDVAPSTQGRQNIVIETLQLFKRMCNTKFFSETPIILLLTKYDSFMEKIESTDLICCFSEYTEGCVASSALKFLTDKFLTARSEEKKKKKESQNETFYETRSRSSSIGKPSMHDDDDDHGQIYINFISKSNSVNEIVTNLGGTMKNVLFLKKQEQLLKQKKRVIGIPEKPPAAPTVMSTSAPPAFSVSDGFFSGLKRKVSITGKANLLQTNTKK